MTEPTARLSAALADRYVIERELGAGGMATVYLARDLKHDREVALKVLRPELAAVLGAERFVQEIKTTAQLQHPHILPLFDSGTADGFLYYVMPFIDGETLRDKLSHETQLSIDEAVRVTMEVADALDYAHRHGVIHRDIKPENILLHDGRPMVADFGIALAVSAAAGGRMTETGLSLGTPHYMSPEQATAEKDITARSDVYSLGCVLYEMLAGAPPHLGGSAQQIIMKIVTEEAQPVTKLRKTVPPNVSAAVAKALEKLPADRFESAKAFADALATPSFTLAAATAIGGGAAAREKNGWRARLRDPFVLAPSLIAIAAIAAVIVVARPSAPPAPVPPIRFVLNTSDSTKPIDNYPWPAAISPDGGTVVYTVAATGSSSLLYARRSDQLEGRPIPGTENGYQPYFSPDGSWLAFEAGGKERKVRLDGSQPVTITAASSANGADWTSGDQIVLGAPGGDLHGLGYVNAAGGELIQLTVPDTTSGVRDHLWPIGAPDGRTIVFTLYSGSLSTSRLAVTSLDDGRVVPLGIPGIRPLAVLDGMLVYVQADGAVMAVAFDAAKRRITGRPIPVHDPVPVRSVNNGNSGIFISRGGALVTSRGVSRGKLVWVRRDGSTQPVFPDVRSFAFPRLSPDERRIAVVTTDGQQSDVWIFDRTLSTFSRFTSTGNARSGEWTSDGSHIVFSAGGEEARSAAWSQSAIGASPAQKLFETPLLTTDVSISPDGRSLLVTSLNGNAWTTRRVPLDSEPVARAYLGGQHQAAGGVFSPDSKWVAVASDESGQFEVYVRSFPDPSSRVQISVAGGFEPMWSRDGRRIYYRAGSALMAARVSLSPTFALLGRDTVLADAPFVASTYFAANYDVSSDGTRIVGIQSESNDFQLVVSPNWITEFRRRVAESRGSQ